jgi:hypothetical protein
MTVHFVGLTQGAIIIAPDFFDLPGWPGTPAARL